MFKLSSICNSCRRCISASHPSCGCRLLSPVYFPSSLHPCHRPPAWRYDLVAGVQYLDILHQRPARLIAPSFAARLHLAGSHFAVFRGLKISFVVLNIMLFIIFLRDLRHQNIPGMQTFNTGHMISALFYFSLVNLTFNLALTGTHERYLYHFYPFILMACLGWLGSSRFIHRALLISLFAGALFYGAYLFFYLYMCDLQTNP